MNKTDFFNAMSLLSASVNIITTDGPAGKGGITASAVCSVTDTPPMLLVCINKRSSIHNKIIQNKQVCINILSAGQEDIARIFAGQSDISHDERFVESLWLVGGNGVPVLQGATVNLQGEVSHQQDTGSHTVFFIALSAGSFKENPSSLTYFNRQFHSLGHC